MKMKIVPSREEFRKYAGQGNLIPVYAEVAADMETPVSAYYKISRISSSGPAPYSFLLESVEGGENIGRYSILGSSPSLVFSQEKRRAVLKGKGIETEVEGRDVFEKIQNVIKQYKPVQIPGAPPFSGGAVGYISYDVVSEIEPVIPVPPDSPLKVPEAFFMITDGLLVFDRVLHTIKIISNAFIEGSSPDDVDKAYDKAVETIMSLKALLQTPVQFIPADIDGPEFKVELKSNKTFAAYSDMLEKAKKYIYDGDIIQTVLSQRFSAEIPFHPFAVYRALRRINPSPYMFLLNCGDFSIVGASPEVMAKCEDGKITVRPIAGTRKRGATPEEDITLEKELLADPKERAEHIMLVDLGRNDVGRVAEAGSVKVEDIMTVERYSHVMHIVSSVTGNLDKSQYEPDSVMRSAFPAGTLSGAPKIRAMQIISELENEKRGPYGGTVASY
ncbi:MAG: hypothetical protein A2020_13710, partial [Lentisphaerae bacterium GWF2_45_14]